MTEAWRPDDDDHGARAIGPVRVRVPAKINLHLGVGPLRADGYHELTTVYHAISHLRRADRPAAATRSR